MAIRPVPSSTLLLSTPTVWASGTYYAKDRQVINSNGDLFISKVDHTAGAASEPGIGAQTATYWTAATYGMTANQNLALNAAASLDGTHPPLVKGTDITTDQLASFPSGASAENPLALALVRVVEVPESNGFDESYFTGTIFTNLGQTGNVNIAIPPAGPGLFGKLTVVSVPGGSYYIELTPATGEQVVFDGTVESTNAPIRCATPALGNSICFYTLRTGEDQWQWFVETVSGTWSVPS